MKILYLSCHAILEYEEVKMLHELGHEVFSPGAYVEPRNPGDASLRPGINELEYSPDIRKQYDKIGAAHPGKDGKNHLTKEFVDNFDVVIVMHMPRWVSRNWEAMKHKRVIWRTIGQSVASVEQGMAPYADRGLEIVRYSPREANIPHFAGQSAMIRFYKDPKDYGDWNGHNNRVVTFGQHMKQRNTHCNYSLFEESTRGINRHLFGPGNEGQDWTTGVVPYEQLKQEMRDNRVYFYTGTHPASYTLNFMEAWMTGIPIVAIGPQYGNAAHLRNHDLYEIPDLIQNGVNGFIGNNKEELRAYVNRMLNDKVAAHEIGAAGRAEAIKHFGKDMIYGAWRNYLDG